MSRLTPLLLYLSYGVISAGAFALSLSLGGASVPLAALIGATVLLSCAQVHAHLARSRERLLLHGELANLHKAHRIIGEELERTRLNMAEATAAAEVASVARNQKIVTEVRLLDTLVQELADGVQTRSKEKLDSVLGRPRAPRPKVVTEYEEDFPPSAIFNQLSEAELMAVLQSALEDGGVDVCVQPIVSLPQRKIRFYSAEARLRQPGGKGLDPLRYRHIAQTVGLIQVVDNLLLYRCVQSARSLVGEDKESRVFCRLSPYSLGDGAFFPQFMDFLQHNKDLADTFVFDIETAVYAACGALEKAHLRRLADLGFRFSLDKVGDIDLNLAELRERQFKFVKIAPRVLLKALPTEDESFGVRLWGLDEEVDELAADLINDVEVVDAAQDDGRPDELGDVPALRREGETALAEPGWAGESFKESLDRYGLDLIAVDVRTEREVIEVIELDADYGQGPLFGELHSLDGAEAFTALPSRAGEDSSPDMGPRRAVG